MNIESRTSNEMEWVEYKLCSNLLNLLHYIANIWTENFCNTFFNGIDWLWHRIKFPFIDNVRYSKSICLWTFQKKSKKKNGSSILISICILKVFFVMHCIILIHIIWHIFLFVVPRKSKIKELTYSVNLHKL